jgi:F-type H+-transporting ATPase subunit gamma
LCGPFNTNAIKAAQQVIADNEGHNVSMMIVGKKGVDFFGKRPYPIAEKFLDYGKNLNYEYAKGISDLLVESFIEEKVDQVYLIYNKFKNVVVQIPITVSLLPIALDGATGEEEIKEADIVDYEYEPSAEDILGGMLTLYTDNMMFQALLESAASENGARMTAMDAATKNAKEMIDNLTLEYNTARQAAITTELIEVVTGADALSG